MAKITRCKFVCLNVIKSKGYNPDSADGFVYEAEFSAVTGKSEEDEAFYTATPCGSLKLSTIKEPFFEAGKDYYLDIVEAGEEE